MYQCSVVCNISIFLKTSGRTLTRMLDVLKQKVHCLCILDGDEEDQMQLVADSLPRPE